MCKGRAMLVCTQQLSRFLFEINSKQYMKKYTLSPNYSILMAILSGITAVWVICLFIQAMTYQKQAVRVANTDYVREVTRWPGHTQIINIPIYKG